MKLAEALQLARSKAQAVKSFKTSPAKRAANARWEKANPEKQRVYVQRYNHGKGKKVSP